MNSRQWRGGMARMTTKPEESFSADYVSIRTFTLLLVLFCLPFTWPATAVGSSIEVPILSFVPNQSGGAVAIIVMDWDRRDTPKSMAVRWALKNQQNNVQFIRDAEQSLKTALAFALRQTRIPPTGPLALLAH